MAVRLLYLFEELNKIGTTVVIATHNEALVERFHHPITRLSQGQVTTDEKAVAGSGQDNSELAASQGIAGQDAS